MPVGRLEGKDRRSVVLLGALDLIAKAFDLARASLVAGLFELSKRPVEHQPL